MSDSTSPPSIANRKEMDRIKGPWSPKEDDLLQRLVQTHGPRNWSLISKSIPGRSVSAGSGYPVSTGLYMNPGSPSGSDMSDSRGPQDFTSPQIFRPVARTGGVSVDVNVTPAAETTASSNNDPPTSLSLSLPGADSSEVSNHAPAPANSTNSADPIALMVNHNQIGSGSGILGFNAEFTAVVQEMIRAEVRNYMVQMQQRQNGGGGGKFMQLSGGDVGFMNTVMMMNRWGVSSI